MNEYALGVAAGFLFVFFVIVIYYAVRGRKKKPVYDERQMLARNAAYKRAFGTLVLCCMICGILDIFEIKWATVYVQMYLSIFISLGVFAVQCIVKDAYSALNESKNRTLYILLAVGALNLVVFIVNLIGGKPLLTDGMLNEQVIQLFISLLFLVVCSAILIKNRLDRKEEANE